MIIVINLRKNISMEHLGKVQPNNIYYKKKVIQKQKKKFYIRVEFLIFRFFVMKLVTPILSLMC